MISVALATYNGEKFVRQQINSILSQTIGDFELIICDDCSTDKTRDVLAEFKTVSQVKIYFNEVNLGFKKNFEKLITLCSGEYIAFSDQDDIWEENHLEVLLNNMESVSISCANSLYVDKENRSLNKTFDKVVGLNTILPKNEYLLRIFFNSNFVQGASMMMRTDFARNLLPIPEKIKYHDCWFAMNGAMQDGICFVPEIITRYRQHGENETAQVDKFAKIKKIFSVFILRTGFATDRFFYFEELIKLYPNSDREDFCFIKEFMTNRYSNKISKKDKIFLKKNFNRIMTTETKSNFFAEWIKWKNWVPSVK